MDIKLRDAVKNDAHLLLQWRNDPVAARNSLNGNPIEWHEHKAWFDASLENPNRYIMIGEFEPDRPCGTIRFDRIVGDQEGPWNGAEVFINIDPHLRGRGLGKAMLKKGIELFGQEALFATIRGENVASLIIFLASGFQLVEYNQVTGLAYLKREPK